jgi:hypothetical protein
MSRNPNASAGHFFAPGAIERHRRSRRHHHLTNPAQRRELKRWLIGAAITTAVATSIGLMAGLITALAGA